MATSGSTDFSVTRNELIEGAYRLAGVIDSGEVPTTSQYTVGAQALNMMVKAWEADGMPLWAMKQYAVTLTATADYTIGIGQTVNTPKPLRVVQALLNNTATNVRIPMRILTRDEYNRLGNITTTGQPIQIFYEPLVDSGVLHTFPVPDTYSIANTQIILIYQRPFEDFDAATDTPDFPQEWYEAVKYGLAVRLSGENTLSLQIRQLLKQDAKEIKDEALGFGTEEGSFYFQLDYRGW